MKERLSCSRHSLNIAFQTNIEDYSDEESMDCYICQELAGKFSLKKSVTKALRNYLEFRNDVLTLTNPKIDDLPSTNTSVTEQNSIFVQGNLTDLKTENDIIPFKTNESAEILFNRDIEDLRCEQPPQESETDNISELLVNTNSPLDSCLQTSSTSSPDISMTSVPSFDSEVLASAPSSVSPTAPNVTVTMSDSRPVPLLALQDGHPHYTSVKCDYLKNQVRSPSLYAMRECMLQGKVRVSVQGYWLVHARATTTMTTTTTTSGHQDFVQYKIHLEVICCTYLLTCYELQLS